jgi:HK97 family phage major capsid protein
MAGKTVAEQLATLKATREANQKKLREIAQKSIDEGRSMDTAEATEFDELEASIKTLDADIARLSRLEAVAGAQAKSAAEDAAERANTPARPTAGDSLQLKQVEKLEPGIAMARYAMCLVAAKGNHAVATSLAERHYPKTESVVRTLKAQAEGANLQSLMQMKATVAAGDTLNATWAAPLVYASNWGGDFINYLRPRTLIGQANFRPIPFNVRIAGATSGGTGYWVGQGKAKPVTSFAFNSTTVPFTKVAAISVITQELARFSDPSAEALVRDMLAEAVIERIDNDLFDPDKAAVANVSPAGLLNGVAPVAGPASLDPDAIRAALMRLWAAWDSTNIGARPAYYTTPGVARARDDERGALHPRENACHRQRRHARRHPAARFAVPGEQRRLGRRAVHPRRRVGGLPGRRRQRDAGCVRAGVDRNVGHAGGLVDRHRRRVVDEPRLHVADELDRAARRALHLVGPASHGRHPVDRRLPDLVTLTGEGLRPLPDLRSSACP